MHGEDVKSDMPTFILFKHTVPEARPVQETKIRAFYLEVLKKERKRGKKSAVKNKSTKSSYKSNW